MYEKIDMQRSIDALLLRAADVRTYLAPAIWAITPVRRENFPSMACDQYYRLYYGDEIFDLWNRAERTSIFLTLLYRLILNHAERAVRVRAYPNLWQLASMLETNSIVADEGLKLPEGTIMPNDLGLPSGQLVETYYSMLLKLATESDDATQPNPDPLSDDVPNPTGGNAGSCADGQAAPWDDDQPAPDGQPTEDIPAGQHEHKAENVRQEVAERIRKSRGDVPAGLARWADYRLEPQVDWRAELRALIRRAVEYAHGFEDFSYFRPPRRTPQTGFVLPSAIGAQVNIAVVIDTSGSMSKREVSQAVAEVGGILKDIDYCQNVDVLCCDALTHTAKKVFRPEQIVIKGGGGTDMRIGIADALKRIPRPEVVIVITDGGTPWPKYDPGTPVIAALTTKPTEHLPIWLKLVVIEMGEGDDNEF